MLAWWSLLSTFAIELLLNSPVQDPRFLLKTQLKRVNSCVKFNVSNHTHKFIVIIHYPYGCSVVKPREQVVDAEVILNLASTLLNSAKSHSLGVFTPADFVSSIIRQFPGDSQERQSGNAADLICWKDIGLAAAPVFMKGKGCLTMSVFIETLVSVFHFL